MAIIAVLFDTSTGMLLGRGGQWVPATEFEKVRPEKVEDLIPNQEQFIASADPSPTYKCINGILHLCYGLRCYSLGRPC